MDASIAFKTSPMDVKFKLISTSLLHHVFVFYPCNFYLIEHKHPLLLCEKRLGPLGLSRGNAMDFIYKSHALSVYNPTLVI